MTLHLASEVVAKPLAAQDSAALRQVFEHLTAASCPQSFNFHLHTVHSDGRLQPEQLIQQAIAHGLKGLAITDHHSVNGYQQAAAFCDRLRSEQPLLNLPHLWTGTEITANLLQDEVHILAYAFDPRHPALHPYQQSSAPTGDAAAAGQVIAAIHQAGGLAVLAHPARYRRSPGELIPAAADLGIDGIETYYAYNNPEPWRPSLRQTEAVQQLGETYGLLNTCGTDTHGMSILQRL